MDVFKRFQRLRTLAPSQTTGDSRLGMLWSRHYTTYVDDVKRLKREGDTDGAERLLLALVDVIEMESRATGQGVAPWYYDELAILYRARKDYTQEVAVLERFQRQLHARGVRPQQLAERLEKARKLLAT